jgi:Uma2 family endonuclease
MQLESIRHPFTVEDYNRMVDAGILRKYDRVELLDGEILDMSPIGDRHAVCVDRAVELLLPPLMGRAIVRVQGPLQVGDHSKPQPDLILLHHKRSRYVSKSPTTDDAYLVIEISDSSIDFDTGPKLRVYSRHRVNEVWVLDLTTDSLVVFRNSDGKGYATRLDFHPGDTVSPLAFPDLMLPVTSLLCLDLSQDEEAE